MNISQQTDIKKRTKMLSNILSPFRILEALTIASLISVQTPLHPLVHNVNINTLADTKTLSKKRGTGKSFLNTTPSSISVAMIWVKPKTNVPVSLSANDRRSFAL